MRIDTVQVAAAAAQALEGSAVQSRSVPARPTAEVMSTPSATSQPSAPQMTQRVVSVSVEDNRIIVYRFLDQKTGDLIEQVPPEELLRIARNIQDLLQSQQQDHQNLDVRA